MMIKSEHIDKLAQALAQAQAKMSHAVKNAKNPFLDSSYADLTEVIDAVKGPLNENGISFVQIVEPEGVLTILLHISGQYIGGVTPTIVAPAKSSKEVGPQALGSAITYAKRYGLAAMVGLATEDDDGEKAERRERSRPCAPENKPIPEPSKQEREWLQSVLEKLLDSAPEGQTVSMAKLSEYIWKKRQYKGEAGFPTDLRHVVTAATYIVSSGDIRKLCEPVK